MSSLINRIPRKVVLPNSIIDKPLPVVVANPIGTVDDLGRIITSELLPVFDSTLSYSEEPRYWDTVTTGVGTTSYNMEGHNLTMSVVGGGIASRIIRQTYFAFPFAAGTDLVYIMGAQLNSNALTDTGFISQVGAYDTLADKTVDTFPTGTGAFYRYSEDGYSVVLRTTLSGVQTDFEIKQNDWNFDRMDGTGPSGYVLDPSTVETYAVHMSIPGQTEIIMGIISLGGFQTAHIFSLTGQNATVTSLSSSSLPARYEIITDGTNVEDVTMIQASTSVKSVGQLDTRNNVFVARRTVNESITNTIEPLLSLRKKVEDLRPYINMIDKSVIAISGSNMEILIIRFIAVPEGSSPLGGPIAFTDVNTANSATEQDQGGNTLDLTGTFPFIILESTFLANNQDAGNFLANSNIRIGADVAGNRDLLVLAAQTINATENLRGSITFQEYY